MNKKEKYKKRFAKYIQKKKSEKDAKTEGRMCCGVAYDYEKLKK